MSPPVRYFRKMCPYTTSEEHLPEEPEGEATMQVTDTESREIFWTRARIARDPQELKEPEPLTVVRGPHENIEEQWYVEMLETDVEESVDDALLRECIEETREESDLLNARSAELRALLEYLVRCEEYDSLSDAVRSLLSAQLAEQYPALVEEYVDERTNIEREEMAATLQDG
jgi:hypothetical protein